MKKHVIIMPIHSMPVDASKGGAIEQLLNTLINKNEEKGDVKFYIISPCSIAAKWENTEVITIKINKFFAKLKTAFYLVLKKFKVLKSRRYSARYYNEALKICDKLNPDVIMFQSKYPKNINNFTKRFGKEKLMFHVHIQEHDKEDVSKYFGTLVSVSKFIEKDFSANNLIKQEIRLEVLNNCLANLNFLKTISEEEKQNLRTQMGFKQDDFIIFYCGRLHKDKGPDILINAFNCLDNEKCKLLIVGESFFKNSKKTKYAKYLSEIAIKKAEKIKFTGYIPNNELYKYYQISNLQVIPTRCEEAAGIVALEGKASKIPQIITNSGGLKEYSRLDAIEINKECDVINNLKEAIEKVVNNEIVFNDVNINNIYDADFYYKKYLEITNI